MIAADGSARLIYPDGVSLTTTDGSADEVVHRRATDGAFDDYLVSLKEGPPAAREQARGRIKGSHSGNGTFVGSASREASVSIRKFAVQQNFRIGTPVAGRRT